MTTKEKVLEQRQKMNVRNSRPCSDCCEFKKDTHRDSLTVGDLCTYNAELPFKVSPDDTCDRWCF